VFKARFSVYHNTLDNGAFTYVSAFLAVTLTAFLYIYKIKKDKRAENIIVEHRQYGKPLVSNSLMTIWVIPLFIFIRIGMSTSNENYMSDEVVKINYTVTVFFKVVVIICLLIKQLLFLDSGERHQQVHSF
jgi:succinate dehydrogenase hydrophobic anchor subunit